MTDITAPSEPTPDTGNMDEMKELLLIWTIALVLMLAGIGIAQYATQEPQFTLESTGSR